MLPCAEEAGCLDLPDRNQKRAQGAGLMGLVRSAVVASAGGSPVNRRCGSSANIFAVSDTAETLNW
jgi:hypothetical protein